MLLFFEREALVGFQGRGCAEVVQPNCCHPFLLEAFLFQWPSIRRCASRTMVEHKTPESNKSDFVLLDFFALPCLVAGIDCQWS